MNRKEKDEFLSKYGLFIEDNHIDGYGCFETLDVDKVIEVLKKLKKVI